MESNTTNKKWNDVLPGTTVNTLLHLLDDCQQKMQLLPADKNQQPLCSLFFYGGDKEKRKAAAALAVMRTGQQVYRIDLSAIVSKSIGETEKNLDAAFNKAANNNWILFFEEADALFGKRSEEKDAHDRYAGLEINWLLQRMVKYANPVIVSFNNRQQLTASVAGQFNALIDFSAKE